MIEGEHSADFNNEERDIFDALDDLLDSALGHENYDGRNFPRTSFRDYPLRERFCNETLLVDPAGANKYLTTVEVSRKTVDMEDPAVSWRSTITIRDQSGQSVKNKTPFSTSLLWDENGELWLTTQMPIVRFVDGSRFISAEPICVRASFDQISGIMAVLEYAMGHNLRKEHSLDLRVPKGVLQNPE